MDLFEKIDLCPDAFFRARARHEYGTIRNWTAKLVDFSSALVLDFGCGQGIAAAAFALQHPTANVKAFDVVPPEKEKLNDLCLRNVGVGVPDNLDLVQVPGVAQLGGIQKFDLVYSWSVFEHIPAGQIGKCLVQIRDALAPGGVFFMQINPLYFSPFGSHLSRYCNEPWFHLTQNIDEIRSVYVERNPSSEREWDQFVELNRLTACDFHMEVLGAGFEVLRYEILFTDYKPTGRLLRVYKPETLVEQEVRILARPL